MRKSYERAYKAYRKCGSVHLAAEHLGLRPSHVRRQLKEYVEALGYDGSEFHQPSQTEKINQYAPQTYNCIRQLMGQDTMTPIYICEIDGEVRAVSAKKAEGTLIGVYEKGSPSEFMRDDLYWYITTHMEAQDDTQQAIG